MHLRSDNIEREPECSSDIGGEYFFQIFKLNDNSYLYGKYSFCISLDIEEYSTNRQKVTFSDITEETKLPDKVHYNRSISFFDINKDDLLDILYDGRLYLNKEEYEFKEITENIGLDGTPLFQFFIDINLDGLEDIVFVNCTDKRGESYLFLNQGQLRFSKKQLLLPRIVNPVSFSITDINNDAYPDIFIAQSNICESSKLDEGILHNHILINNKNNGFVDISNKISELFHMRNTKSIRFMDIDNDSDRDILICSFDSSSKILINDGDLNFKAAEFLIETKDSILSRNKYLQGFNKIDMNNDGVNDLIVTKATNLTISI